MKHLFITGASGFIGKHIVDQFLDHNWHITALIHKSKPEGLEYPADYTHLEYVHGDITDFESMRNAFIAGNKQYDAVVHCAGRASDVGWRREFRRANLDSVKHLVQLTKQLDIAKFVFISTTDVYGLLDFNGEAEEELRTIPHPANPYPEFKILAEEHIRAELPLNRFSVLRPAQVWGPGDTTLTKRIVDFLKWSPFIVHFGKWRGGNRWPLAHVYNVATAAYLATTLDEACGQAINVVDNETTSIDDFYRIATRIFLPEKKFRTVVLPFPIGWIIGSVVSGISNIFNMNHPFMDPSLYALYSVSRNLDFNNDKLKTLFDIAGSTIFTRKEGIRELRHIHGKGRLEIR